MVEKERKEEEQDEIEKDTVFHAMSNSKVSKTKDIVEAQSLDEESVSMKGLTALSSQDSGRKRSSHQVGR